MNIVFHSRNGFLSGHETSVESGDYRLQPKQCTHAMGLKVSMGNPDPFLESSKGFAQLSLDPTIPAAPIELSGCFVPKHRQHRWEATPFLAGDNVVSLQTTGRPEGVDTWLHLTLVLKKNRPQTPICHIYTVYIICIYCLTGCHQCSKKLRIILSEMMKSYRFTASNNNSIASFPTSEAPSHLFSPEGPQGPEVWTCWVFESPIILRVPYFWAMALWKERRWINTSRVIQDLLQWRFIKLDVTVRNTGFRGSSFSSHPTHISGCFKATAVVPCTTTSA